jgi:hypothetical protein
VTCDENVLNILGSLQEVRRPPQPKLDHVARRRGAGVQESEPVFAKRGYVSEEGIPQLA